MLKPFYNKIKKIVHVEENNLPFLMNKALPLVEGKYINFLQPGEVYISKYVVRDLKKAIIEKKFPNFISSAYLKRNEIESPEVTSFSFEDLKKGKIPIKIQACLFSVETIKKLYGFDMNYQFQPGFDMICRIFSLKEKNILFFDKALTDYQLKKKPSKVFILLAWEKLKIIYKNFGLFKTIYWWIMYDHFKMIKFALISIKNAFWRP